jgi:hypothetical protein
MLCYVKCKRLIRKFLKTNQTVSEKEKIYTLLIPNYTDAEYENLKKIWSAEELFTNCWTSISGTRQTIFERVGVDVLESVGRDENLLRVV